MATRSQFGEMFGGINALFTGLAFLGVIFTVLLQKEELRLQRKELELTRKELTRTAEAQEKSEKALTKQAASLKATAKLNGLSAVLQYHCSMIEAETIARHGLNGASRSRLVEAEQVVGQIKEIIEGK